MRQRSIYTTPRDPRGRNRGLQCGDALCTKQHTIGMSNEGQCQGSFLRATANVTSQANMCILGGLITRAQSGSAPLNFIDDLPRFVVFSWILRRLTREVWGSVPIMRPLPAEGPLITAEAQGKAKEEPKIKLPLTAPAEIECKGEIYFTENASAREHHIWGLNGRKTWVREMSARDKPGVIVAVKVAWQEKSRISEQQIFERIDVAKVNPEVKGHVPELLQELLQEETLVMISIVLRRSESMQGYCTG